MMFHSSSSSSTPIYATSLGFLALLSSQCGVNAAAQSCLTCDESSAFMDTQFGVTVVPAGSRRKLEEDESGLAGDVVMGNYDDNGIFVATNATNFPQGITNGALTVAIADSGDCNSDAYGSASKFPVEKAVTYEINELGMIEGEGGGGWFLQSIRETAQENSTLPASMAELVNGDGSEHALTVYLHSLSPNEELLGCAFLKKLDEQKAAEYDKLLNGLSQDQEAVDDSSSGSKNGLFMFLFATVAVGIATVLGDVLAL